MRCLPSIMFLIFVALTACSDVDNSGNKQAQVSTQVADILYHSGRVYTVDAGNTWAEALAIKDGHFLAVGTNEDVLTLKGPETELVDLGGHMVMPGIHDAHAHPADVGLRELFECSFPYSLSMSEILQELTACAAAVTPGAWLRGGQWAIELLDTEQAPHRSALDAIAPDNPVFIMDSSVHAGWLNTRALELLGIDKNTPDPEGGVIVRDKETGEATGILLDEAAYSAMAQLPGYSVGQIEQALAHALSQMNAVGVTGVKDALVDVSTLKAYSSLDTKSQLHTQIATSLSRSGWSNSTDEDQATILDKRKLYESETIAVDFVKIMLDGIPPTRTAAMLEPYLPDGLHAEGYRGELTQSVEQFTQDLVQLDAAGLAVKAHATGDRAVRVVLDAVEKARKVNGDSGLQHEVSHAGLIHPDDLPRFKALNVVAEMSPIIWYPSPLQDAMAAVLGPERVARFYQVRSLGKTGALLVYGSDWPAVVPSPSPWPGIEAMVTRGDPYGEFEGTLNPGEAIELPEAIRIFTINGARTMDSAEKTGTIEVGKSANFIELDRNLFDISTDEISETKVLRTVFKGRTVHELYDE